MIITNDFQEKAKLAALEAAIKIEAMNPTKPIIMVDMASLPEGITPSEWIKEYEKGNYLTTPTIESKQPEIIDLATNILLERSQKIYNWLIEE